MKLFILRHGTTDWNARRRIQGSTDIPLDEKGEEIARMTGEALLRQGVRFDTVFSSPLIRAVRTAELVSPGSVIHTDPRLRELRFGPFEGRSVPELTQEEHCPFRYFHSHPEKYDEAVLPLETNEPEKGYESLSSLLHRAGDFMKSVIEPLAAKAPEETCVLISGHGALNRALIMYIHGSTDMKGFWGRGLQSNCGFCILDVSAGSSGDVLYSVRDENRVFYDPEAMHIPRLLPSPDSPADE